jgi:pyruvate-formate lyase-activating enzyme
VKPKQKEICSLYADRSGAVWDFPGIEPAFRTGNRFVKVNAEELIKLPYGSYLFSLPGRFPVFYNRRNNDFNHIEVSPDGDEITAVSAFLASSYLRTYLPAYITREEAPVLSMWAYTGVVFMDGEFYIPGLRIDDDVRSDPSIHENDTQLAQSTAALEKRYPVNRLVRQLAKCASLYRCLCARNFFLGRFEAPIPTSPACNARCEGCLSFQQTDSPFAASQERLDFKPSPEEISEVILHHVRNVPDAVASFGQGCEGEPLLREADLAAAIRLVRETTDKGTINLNTNGSIPEGVNALIKAGLDSIRVSLNSPTREYYDRYHRPAGFSFDDVMRSIETALNAGIFVSLNLFFMPGFTDMESEVGELLRFLARFPVNMIQTRNLNIDPDYYFRQIGYRESEPMGIVNLVRLLEEKFPGMRLGYYNPPLKR